MSSSHYDPIIAPETPVDSLRGLHDWYVERARHRRETAADLRNDADTAIKDAETLEAAAGLFDRAAIILEDAG